MSTRDMNIALNSSYKLATGEFVLSGSSGYSQVGHYMPLVGKVDSNGTSEYGSIWPHAGPLLVVNDDDQSWVIDCNIEFDYDYAELSGWETGYIDGTSYDIPVYITGSAGIGNISIPSGSTRFSQHLFDDNKLVYNIRNIVSNDPDQNLKFYVLGDDGARLLYGMENETNRTILDKATRSLFVAPPECVLCDGTGLYEGNVCPQCFGAKYIGYNAEGGLLIARAKDIEIRKRDETERQFQHRAWAKKQWVNPTTSGIINYISLIANVDEEDITIYTPTGTRELKYYVRFPLGAGGTASLDEGGLATNIIISNKRVLQELLDEVSPAGTAGIVEPYYALSDVSEMDYQNGYANPIVEVMSSSRRWYSRFSTSGTVIVGSGWITSGYQTTGAEALTQHLRFFDSRTSWDGVDNFYNGLTSGEYDEIFRFDNAWIVTGTATGYYTGTKEDGFTGIYFTGTTGLYR